MLDIMTRPAAAPFARNFIGVRRRYLDEVAQPSMLAAAKAHPPVRRLFTIAGKHIQFQFYGHAAAERLSAALAHNEVAHDAVPDLTIHIWDSASARIAPPAPWTRRDCVYDPLAEMERPESSFHGAYVAGEGAVSLYDEASDEAYLWLADFDRIPGWVLAAPARTVLHWFLSRSNVYLVHGATVAKGGRAVLITARGGSGKSTTALSCVAAGFDYLSDDYVGISTGDGAVVHSLYNSAKLTPDGLLAFPELRRFVRDKPLGDNGKAVIYLTEAAPEQLRREAPLTAILIPVLHKADRTHLLPAGKKQAFLALAPTTVFQLPFAGADMIAPLKMLIDRIPCHFLMLGPDVREVSSGIDRFLRDPAT